MLREKAGHGDDDPAKSEGPNQRMRVLLIPGVRAAQAIALDVRSSNAANSASTRRRLACPRWLTRTQISLNAGD
jgi:hypothetical protein